MGRLKRYLEENGDLNYPHPSRDSFENDISYDEYMYHRLLEEAK